MLKDQIAKHRARPFPAECRGKDVEGIDLVLLDSDTIGCLEAYLGAGVRLGVPQASILGRCFHDLAVVLPRLGADARGYFEDLESMAHTALTELSASGIEA